MRRVTKSAESEKGLESIPRSYQIASWILMGFGLFAIVALHLLAALLAGLLVFQVVHMLARAIRIPYLTSRNAKAVFVAILAMVVVSALVLAGVGIEIFLRKGPDNLSLMLAQMASVIDDLRRILPGSILVYMPADADSLKADIATWFREHATEIRTIGTETLRVFLHIVIGLIIGAMIALHEVTPHGQTSPFLRALTLRAHRLSEAFRRILVAQVPISAINTTLTAIYLAVVLPQFDIHLPFTKTLIAVTFIAGLLPVVGNLISNTAIFLVSLSHSFAIAAASLGYLIVIHKLEYFLNARIVGTRINAKAWELLIAMLVFESAFGISGLIVAPLAYAYLKHELGEERLM